LILDNIITKMLLLALKDYRVCIVLFAESSTSDAAIKKKEGSHSTVAVSLSVVDELYCRFKLSFTIENIQMELFTGDRDVVNFVIVILTTQSNFSSNSFNLSCML